jgi:hypothetical protein
MLADCLPGLKNSSPGNIQEEALPNLRNFVVFDPQADLEQQQRPDFKSIINWRDILVWTREDTLERRISQSLHKDDVINLQFTRCGKEFLEFNVAY